MRQANAAQPNRAFNRTVNLVLLGVIAGVASYQGVMLNQSGEIEMESLKTKVGSAFTMLLTFWSLLFITVTLADDAGKQLAGTWKLTA